MAHDWYGDALVPRSRQQYYAVEKMRSKNGEKIKKTGVRKGARVSACVHVAVA